MDVWMDEYGEYVKKRRPHFRNVNPGDLTEQHAVRQKLQCKSFDWFMKNVAFDLVKKYPPEDPLPSAVGRIHKASDGSYCIALGEGGDMTLAPCGQSQGEFKFTWRDDVVVVGT